MQRRIYSSKSRLCIIALSHVFTLYISFSVVILDEIDSLITRDQDVLYKIFEWASLPDSRLVLIGISNALDLTDRVLPRLRAKSCEPQLLNFNPYQVSEISSIIKDRLFSLLEDPENPFGPPPKPVDGAVPPLMLPMAIEFCARKVASSMGDLRTALDVCRQAIEVAEMDQKRKAKAASGVLGEQKSNTTATAPAPAPVVSVAHVSRVLNVVFGNSNVQKLKQLNLQQKIVLGVIIIMIRSSTTKTNKKDLLTVGKVKK
jgi:cell division control protein 6